MPALPCPHWSCCALGPRGAGPLPLCGPGSRGYATGPVPAALRLLAPPLHQACAPLSGAGLWPQGLPLPLPASRASVGGGHGCWALWSNNTKLSHRTSPRKASGLGETGPALAQIPSSCSAPWGGQDRGWHPSPTLLQSPGYPAQLYRCLARPPARLETCLCSTGVFAPHARAYPPHCLARGSAQAGGGRVPAPPPTPAPCPVGTRGPRCRAALSFHVL